MCSHSVYKKKKWVCQNGVGLKSEWGTKDQLIDLVSMHECVSYQLTVCLELNQVISDYCLLHVLNTNYNNLIM